MILLVMPAFSRQETQGPSVLLILRQTYLLQQGPQQTFRRRHSLCACMRGCECAWDEKQEEDDETEADG